MKNPINIIVSSRWGKAGLFALAYILFAMLGQLLIFTGSPNVTFWLPSGLFVAVLLISDSADWPYFILAAFPSNFIFDQINHRPILVSLLFFTGNMLEAVAGASLVRWVTKKPFDLSTTREWVSLTFFSGIFSSMISATMGASVVWYFFQAPSFFGTWSAWWSGDLLGILIGAPLVVTWLRPVPDHQALSMHKIVELVLLGVCLVVSTFMVFLIPQNFFASRTYFLIPILIWSAMRFSTRTTITMILILAVTAVWGTTHGFGAFASPETIAIDEIASLQVFLGISSFTIMLLQLVWVENINSAIKLRRSETGLRRAQNVSHVGSWVWHIKSNRIEWSDEMYRIFGIQKDQFTGNLEDVLSTTIHPDDRARVEESNRSVSQDKQPIPLEYRIVWPDQSVHTVWAQAGELVLDANKNPDFLSGFVQDITERKKAEIALQESQELFRLAFENASLGMAIINLDGQYNRVNPKMCQIFGYSRQELEGLHVNAITHPDELHKFLKFQSEALSNGPDQVTYEKRYFHKNGQILLALVSVSLVKNIENQPLYFISLILDITQQKATEQAVRQSEQRFSLLFRQSPIPFYLGRLSDGTAIDANQSFLDLIGSSKEEVLENYSLDLDGSGQGHQTNILETIREQKILAGIDRPLRTKSGELRDTTWWFVELDFESEAGYLAMALDLTERKKSEQLIRTALQEKEALLRELYHRTKNNMQVICAMLDLQASLINDPNFLFIFQDIQNRIQAMALVHQKLYQTHDLSSIDLKEYIEDLVKLLFTSYSVYASRVEPVLQLQNCFVTLDIAIPVGQIITELITNSLHHGFPGDRAGTIQIGLSTPGDNLVHLDISDNGVGASKGFDPRTDGSMGMQTIIMIGEHQLQGIVSFDTENGFGCHIQFDRNIYHVRV